MTQQLVPQTLESGRIINNLIERGLRDIREMSERIEARQDLIAYGDYLAFVKPFKSDKGEKFDPR